MSINSIGYYGCYAPRFIENHSIPPEAAAIRKKVNEEIQIKQAYVKVEFLENTLANQNLTRPERNALECDLNNARREFERLKYGN